MQSNKTLYLLFKYALLGAGILIIVTPSLAWLIPGSVSFNNEEMSPDWFSAMIFGLIGLFLILVFLAIKHKFVLVKMGNQSLTFKSSTKEYNVT